MDDFFGLQVVWPPDGTRPPNHDHDIVFVHGLQKGSVSDWKDEDGNFWPVDRLGLDLGTARIFCFGYDQTKLSIRSDGLYQGGVIFEHGLTLSTELRTARSADKVQVPLTLIGHGAGGIVIQSALCLTLSPIHRYRSIFRKTRHVVFLETPRQPSLTKFAWDLVAQGSPCKDDATRQMLWSLVAANVHDDFGKLADRLNITSAYRKLDQLAGGDPYDENTYSPRLPHEKALVLERLEQRTITELVARDDHYEQLLSRIRADRVCTTNAEHHVQRLRLWLGTPSNTFSDINHQRNLQHYHPNTGRWLFEHPTFRDWARPEGDISFIWLTGPEGCGKSILASQAVDRIAATDLHCATPRLMLSLDKPQSEYELTASLASQLLSHVLDHAGGVDIESLSFLEQDHNKLDRVRALVKLLVSRCSAVFVFVDGVDDIPGFQAEDEVAKSDEEATPDEKTGSKKKQNKDKKKKVGRAQRHLYSTLEFLSGLATSSQSTSTPVRLWCSSARTPFVQEWLRDFGARELHADLVLIAKDVEEYLNHQTKNMKPTSSMPEVSNFLDKVGPSFLLARWVLEYSKTSRSSITDWESSDFAAAASGGLNNFHIARLSEIQRQQSGNDKDLASKTLSILAFAKRPLKFSELQEALAVLSSPLEDIQGIGFGSQDISTEALGKGFQKVEDVIQCCFPFLEVAHRETSPSEDGWIRFSHASTLRFLTTSHDAAKFGISPVFMATACLKYLAQPRYSSIQSAMERLQNLPHNFLPYAAKYWHRNLNSVGDSLLAETKSFIQSPQFLFTIWIQSLFVDQGLPDLDELEDNESLPRGILRLPLCLDADPEGLRLVEDYRSFVQEWIGLLSLSTTTTSTRGQIERCFWGSLPKENFLRRLGTPIEAHQSYLLQEESAVAESPFLYQACSSDGSRLGVWILDEASADTDIVTLVRTSWYIDGERPPCRYSSDETLTTSRKEVLWDMYHDGNRRKTLLVPALNNSVRVPIIQEIVFGQEVRVGNQRFIRQKGGIWTAAPMKDWDEAYWENIVSRGDYVVRSRRKVVAPRTDWPSTSPAKPRVVEVEDDGSASDNDDKIERSIKSSKSDSEDDEEKKSTLSRKPTKLAKKSGSHEEVESSSSENEPDDHLAHGDFEGIVSSAEEYCTNPDPDDEVYDDGSSSGSNSGPDTDLDTESDDVEDGTDGDSGSEEEGLGSSADKEAAPPPPIIIESTPARQRSKEHSSASDDDGSSSVDDSTISTPASDTASDSGSDADDEVSNVDSEATTEPTPDFSNGSTSFTRCETHLCDICGLRLIKKRRQSQATADFYRCLPCASSVSWDICETCFRKGHWCRNRNHPLHMGTYTFHTKKAVHRQVISGSDAPPLANMVVERRLRGHENAGNPVSRFTRRLSNMLHDSNPVIHPKLPLLLFPLDGGELLFLNMEDSTYFTYDIPYDAAEVAQTGAGTCMPLSVYLHFSSCGRYLQVLRFTARNESTLFTPTKLFVTLFTFALNLENPCSGRPEILAPSCGVELGDWPALVHQVPFTVAWTDSDAYIAVTGSTPTPNLRVVRFPIRTETQADDREGNAYTLSEDVTLPTSAMFRSVSFFPATEKGAARVVLGSIRGPPSQPPVVVYLNRGKTSQWVTVRSLSMLSHGTHENRNDPSIEGPDLYDECNAMTSHEAKEKTTTGDGAYTTFNLILPQGLHELVRTSFQTRNIYCPSCFELGIKLWSLAAPRNIQWLHMGIMDSQLQGGVPEDAPIKYSWQMTIPTLIRALENGCQFCSFVAVRLLSGFHVNMTGLFLGHDGPRCCAKGPLPKKKSKEVSAVIKNLRGLWFDPGAPEEARVMNFSCMPMKRDGQAQSFSKMVIEANVSYNQGDKSKGPGVFAPMMLAITGEGGEDGRANTITSFFHMPGMDRGKTSFVMELHSLPDDSAHEWIPTRPITTDRGGDENIAVIKGWLEECRTKHPFCWRKDNTHNPVDEAPLPTRLLEIVDDKSVRLVETQSSQLGQYTILSYCWGPDPKANTLTTRANLETRLTVGIERKDLPAAIRDSVTMTAKLSIKYIWVDALCMVQDDPDDMNRELGRMSAYYRNAHLTLAASTPDCNKGFLGKIGRCEKHTDNPIPRDLVPLRVFCLSDRSKTGESGTVYAREENPYQLAAEPISKRAWTLQEKLLSPRMLFFGGRVIWFCNAATRCDGGVEDWSFDENASDRLTRDFQIELIRGKRTKSWNINPAPQSPSTHLQARRNSRDDPCSNRYDLWHRIVGDYSRRNLSRPEDKLPAISAVAAEFAHLCGSEYLAGLWRSNLARDLLWSTPEAAPTRTKTWRAPSWSWASVDDAILFESVPPSDAVQLAMIDRAEVEPLTPEVPFGQVQDASGALEITGPCIAFDTEGDEDKRRTISDMFTRAYGMQGHQDERSMLLQMLRNLARGDSRDSSKKQDTDEDRLPEPIESPDALEPKKYQLPDKVLMLILFGKQDSGIDRGVENSEAVGEMGDEYWRFWGLILEPVSDSAEGGSYQRTLSFAALPFTLQGQNIAGFQKQHQKTIRII